MMCIGWERGDRYRGDYPADFWNVNNEVVREVAPLSEKTRVELGTWKIWHGIEAMEGSTVVMQHNGKEDVPVPVPGLILKEHGEGKGKTAVITFGIGDIASLNPNSPPGWLVVG